jgi:hypothetical protein
VRDAVRRRASEEGALLIILMVGVAVTMVGLAVAFQTWSTIWRRDNEEELIFRGKQYVEAIRAYRVEQGKLPLNLEELMKPGPRQVRYIRKLFKDPMKKNAKWGLLYAVPGSKAIYDPVVAERAKKKKASSWVTAGSDEAATAAEGGAGFTPYQDDMTGGTGVPNPAFGGQPQTPGAQPPGQPQQGMPPGFQTGGRQGGPRGGMAMPAMAPPPMPPANEDDEKAVSEPPIGWGIAGVISRAIDTGGEGASPETSEGGKTTMATTFKVFKGHEHVDEWQFQIFDTSPELADAPQGPGGRGTNPTFLGPGFGGQGPISGVGGGGRPQFGGQGFSGQPPQGGMGSNPMGGRQQSPGWFPGGGKGGKPNQ